MSLLWMLIVGLVVGALAKLLMPGRDPGGIIVTMLLGVVGAVVAGYGGRALGVYGPGQTPGLIASILGAMALLLVYRLVARRGRSDGCSPGPRDSAPSDAAAGGGAPGTTPACGGRRGPAGAGGSGGALSSSSAKARSRASCSAVSSGDRDAEVHVQVALPPFAQVGQPRPRRVTMSPGWVPAPTSISSSSARVGTLDAAPSAAWAKLSVTSVCRSAPSRSKRGSGVTRMPT